MAKLIIRKRPKQVQYYQEDLGDGIKMDMMFIPKGTFLMGSPAHELERLETEGPQHEVHVSSFFMGKYPVTQGQWKAVCKAVPSAIALRIDLEESKDLNPEPSYFKDPYDQEHDRWTRPVEQVSWYDGDLPDAHPTDRARASENLVRQSELPSRYY